MTSRFRLALVIFTTLAMVPASAFPEPEPVTLELIMSDPIWLGKSPRGAYWSTDGQSIYYRQTKEDESFTDLLRMPLDTEGNAKPAVPVEGPAWASIDTRQRRLSMDRQSALFERGGDLFIRDLRDGSLKQLTRTAERESDPIFMVGDRSVAFQRGPQYFVRDLESGLEYQVADLKNQDDPEEKEDSPSFLEAQQERLFEVVREKQGRAEREKAWNKAKQLADPSAAPLPSYLGKKVEIGPGALSPSGRFLALITAPAKRDEGRSGQMPVFVTADGYTEVEELRARVGTADDPDHALIMLDLESREHETLELTALPGILEDPLAELKAAQKQKVDQDGPKTKASPEEEDSTADDDSAGDDSAGDDSAGDESAGDEPGESKPRSVEIEALQWNPSGTHLAVQIHSYDNKDRWIAISADGGELKNVHHLHLDSWINWSYNELGWLDEDRLWFLSEESGWSQLYLYHVETGETVRLTQSEAVVSDPTLSPDRSYIYFTANPEHPGQYDTYRVEVESRETEKVSHLGGRTSFELSPDGTRLLLSHSSLLQPTELFISDLDKKTEPKRMTQTISNRFSAIDWVEPQIVGIPSSHHDRPIYSRFYPSRNPERLRGPDGKIPAVVFIHGAGYLQNAHKGFSTYFREFMFHTLLSEHGYHVLDMDYRASAGYGVAWRTAIYRQMGTPELEDLSDGVAWLVANQSVDPARAGTYGGSYGGFMTMMALFKSPDLFAAGAALRPVTDWATYNHPYTSNILNTPDVDPEAYRRSSPIELADGLKSPLLICAPMLDDNVFFQDTVRLNQRFIELGQTNFEVALYPVEPHGFRRPSSWLDEYRRIFRHFEKNLAP